MKAYIRYSLLASLLFFASASKAQVLISLLFGNALNTDKIEFGLIGGDNLAFINTIPDAKPYNNFNLGFYFHINMKNNSYLSTGVLVKSNVGATGLPTYPIGDDYFDSLLVDGTLTKKIPYFYVPIMYQQRFNNRWYLEGGFQLGLMHQAKDVFETTVLDGDLEYKLDARDQYKHLDAGLVGGVGYKFKKEIKSIAAGINYYYGLMNVSAVADTKIKNSSIYFYVKVPIGAGKKEEKPTKTEGS